MLGQVAHQLVDESLCIRRVVVAKRLMLINFCFNSFSL